MLTTCRKTRPAGVALTYTLKLKLPGFRCWRSYAFSADHTLEDVHLAIQEAFDWGDDHLYSFDMGFRRGQGPEYGHPLCEDLTSAHRVPLARLGLVKGRTFFYLFDFGDQWHVEIQVLDVTSPPAAVAEPYQVKASGTPPPQYASEGEE